MKLYKLTDRKGYTHGNTKWRKGYTLTLPTKNDPRLCTGDLVHAYKNVNLGLLLNPIHANIDNPILWEAEGEIAVENYGKVGCFALTTKEKMPLPAWYTNKNQRKDIVVMFAILCAESVLNVFENKYPKDDRPKKAIEAAKEYLKTKTSDAAAKAACAANAAANAADAAANAANAAKINFGKLADIAVNTIIGSVK